ncbi:cell division protein ZapA [Crassaminicella thermophila]|uniref:Cell division protein ZapA n=1 Tax=Crassaminicella thermophila TaxID=2599308 RepID=A0A5C0SD76_CRATE|nr:cell division protein ZapA [Crassaminicella thermophila]QEK12485.1 cell division protein ZapA [Crassaminicella thermophila]
MSEKTKVIVRIYGQEYTMVGKESREYMQKVANYVDDKMIDIAKKSKKLSTAMVAVLTSLNIADEYFKVKQEMEDFKKEAMKPLEELEQTRSQLAATLTAFKEKEIEYIKTIEQLEEEKKNHVTNDECEKLKKEIERLKSELNLKDDELENIKRENEELQNKIFESQIKYVQARKELDAFIETFDEKK